MDTPEDSQGPRILRARLFFPTFVGITTAGSIALLGLYFSRIGLDQADQIASIATSFFAAIGVMIATFAGISNLLRQRQEVHQAERARQDLQRAETSLGEAERLTLPALWEVTHKRLDYYHQIATGQARHSFRNAQVAMGVGFVLLVVFAVLALNAATTTASIVTGALGAASAAFAGYIGRTFVRSQEAAAAHLRAYFDQPLEFSRYLAAERLLAGMDKLDEQERAAIAADLLRAMVVPPGSAADTPGNGAASP